MNPAEVHAQSYSGTRPERQPLPCHREFPIPDAVQRRTEPAVEYVGRLTRRGLKIGLQAQTASRPKPALHVPGILDIAERTEHINISDADSHTAGESNHVAVRPPLIPATGLCHGGCNRHARRT